jgi:hypothetical protein
MKMTKKWLGALVLGACSLLSASASWAAFSSVSKSTVNASAVLAGAGSVNMSVALKNVSNNAVAASIGWTGVTLPTSWKTAAQYIELVSTITAATGGVQIYTDNKAADASVVATTGICAGLIDNTDTTKTLSLAWSVKDATSAVTAAAPFDLTTNSGDSTWIYFKDKQSTDSIDTPLSSEVMVDGEDYVTVKDTRGIHFASGATEFGGTSSPDVIYLEANFNTAVTPRTYSAKIRLEAFTE